MYSSSLYIIVYINKSLLQTYPQGCGHSAASISAAVSFSTFNTQKSSYFECRQFLTAVLTGTY